LEISFRLRCTSYLACGNAAATRTGTKPDVHLFCLCRPTSTTRSPPAPAAPLSSLARFSPTARAIVSREDRMRHNRGRTGNKTASPPVLLLETPHASIAEHPPSAAQPRVSQCPEGESTMPSVSSPFPPRFPKFGCPLRELPLRPCVPLARSYPIFRC